MNQQTLAFRDDSDPADTRPVEPQIATLGARPKIKNSEQLSEALASLSAIDALTKTVEAQRQQEIDAVNQRWAARLQLEIDGKATTCELYRQSLIAAIEAFIPGHKPDVFTDGKQTARFACGEVSYKAKNPEVKVDPETKADTIADALAKKSKVRAALDQLLKDCNLEGWLRLEWKLDLTAIKRLYKEKKIDKRNLPKGLIVTDQTESITIKPYAPPERSELSKAA